ncbi:putative DNA glycosylase At3g47830 isoform X2 [Magnolia sinica]|uniref:putative DNA glycosylase At3g47830 isoform X2 n=1 Tax=Magnolia sinica TaxID=86752 RepID=UPI00265833AD|nr:putative DNA glycosylase At3g47830 isoform X2 [Magnolia sinica]
MATKCKRKVEIPGASSKLGKPKTTAAAAAELYPNHPRPTPEECRSVRDHLLSLHGFPQEFARYRKNKVIHDSPDPSKPFFGEDGSDETITRKEGVLDGLVRTLLSQNTTDSNSTKAFASLKSSFPTWEDVLAAETKCIQDAIKCGGLAATKASCIKNILSSLLEKRGKICLEYLRGMPVDEIKAELCCFKGIGPKTDQTTRRIIGGGHKSNGLYYLNRGTTGTDLHCKSTSLLISGILGLVTHFNWFEESYSIFVICLR